MEPSELWRPGDAVEVVVPGPEDGLALGVLLDALNAYYHLPPMTPAERAGVVAALLDGRQRDVLLARRGDQPLGFAVYGFVYPADGPRPGLFLHELFVVAAARGQGVGRRLLARLTEIAQAHDCARIDWAAEAGNTQAMTFYAQIGAERVAEKRYFRVEAARFQAFRDGLE